ncbi:MAG: preprotein translocase subunit YajC [Chitinophagaceae bacterium]
MNLLNFILMAPPAGAGQPQGSPFAMPLMLGGMILVFWLFMIRPQAKKAKEQKKFIDNLKKGDKIVTIAGIHATVNKVNEDGTLQIEVSPGSYLKIEKSTISQEWSANVNKTTVA